MSSARYVIEFVSEIAVTVVENTMENQFRRGNCQNNEHPIAQKRLVVGL
jgi:hypothetical protein